MTLGIINPTNIIVNIVICLLFLSVVNIQNYKYSIYCILVFDINFIKLPTRDKLFLTLIYYIYRI